MSILSLNLIETLEFYRDTKNIVTFEAILVFFPKYFHFTVYKSF